MFIIFYLYNSICPANTKNNSHHLRQSYSCVSRMSSMGSKDEYFVRYSKLLSLHLFCDLVINVLLLFFFKYYRVLKSNLFKVNPSKMPLGVHYSYICSVLTRYCYNIDLSYDIWRLIRCDFLVFVF